MKKNKFNMFEEVYTNCCDKLVKGKICGITKLYDNNFKYEVETLKKENGHYSIYDNEEKNIFKTKEQTKIAIKKYLLEHNKEHYKYNLYYINNFLENFKNSFEYLDKKDSKEIKEKLLKIIGK